MKKQRITQEQQLSLHPSTMYDMLGEEFKDNYQCSRKRIRLLRSVIQANEHFASMTKGNMDMIDQLCCSFSLKIFKKKDVIFHRNQPVKDLYWILTGKISCWEKKTEDQISIERKMIQAIQNLKEGEQTKERKSQISALENRLNLMRDPQLHKMMLELENSKEYFTPEGVCKLKRERLLEQGEIAGENCVIARLKYEGLCFVESDQCKCLHLNSTEYLDIFADNSENYHFIKEQLHQIYGFTHSRYITKLAYQFEAIPFKYNSVVYNEGDKSNCVYVIKSGEIELRMTVDAEEINPNEEVAEPDTFTLARDQEREVINKFMRKIKPKPIETQIALFTKGVIGLEDYDSECNQFHPQSQKKNRVRLFKAISKSNDTVLLRIRDKYLDKLSFDIGFQKLKLTEQVKEEKLKYHQNRIKRLQEYFMSFTPQSKLQNQDESNQNQIMRQFVETQRMLLAPIEKNECFSSNKLEYQQSSKDQEIAKIIDSQRASSPNNFRDSITLPNQKQRKSSYFYTPLVNIKVNRSTHQNTSSAQIPAKVESPLLTSKATREANQRRQSEMPQMGDSSNQIPLLENNKKPILKSLLSFNNLGESANKKLHPKSVSSMTCIAPSSPDQIVSPQQIQNQTAQLLPLQEVTEQDVVPKISFAQSPQNSSTSKANYCILPNIQIPKNKSMLLAANGIQNYSSTQNSPQHYLGLGSTQNQLVSPIKQARKVVSQSCFYEESSKFAMPKSNPLEQKESPQLDLLFLLPQKKRRTINVQKQNEQPIKKQSVISNLTQKVFKQNPFSLTTSIANQQFKNFNQTAKDMFPSPINSASLIITSPTSNYNKSPSQTVGNIFFPTQSPEKNEQIFIQKKCEQDSNHKKIMQIKHSKKNLLKEGEKIFQQIDSLQIQKKYLSQAESFSNKNKNLQKLSSICEQNFQDLSSPEGDKKKFNMKHCFSIAASLNYIDQNYFEQSTNVQTSALNIPQSLSFSAANSQLNLYPPSSTKQLPGRILKQDIINQSPMNIKSISPNVLMFIEENNTSEKLYKQVVPKNQNTFSDQPRRSSNLKAIRRYNTIEQGNSSSLDCKSTKVSIYKSQREFEKECNN